MNKTRDNDLLVIRADDESGAKYYLIADSKSVKLNRYVGDSGITLWTAAPRLIITDANSKKLYATLAR